MGKHITAGALSAAARRSAKNACIQNRCGEWCVSVYWKTLDTCFEWEEKRFMYRDYDDPEAAKQAALTWLAEEAENLELKWAAAMQKEG